MPQRYLAASLSLLICFPALAQSTKTDAEVDAEAAQANALYQKAQLIDSLPLYEDLHKQRPTTVLYTERLALAYIAHSGAQSSPQLATSDRSTARRLFNEAKAGGDNSDLLQIMLEKLDQVDEATPDPPLPPNDPRAPGGEFAQAEQFFGKGDLKSSVEHYGKSADAFPKFYYSPLYAGDAEYKQGHYDQAAAWFARAIAIDPDIETAHRYWADCLMKAGKPAQAHEQYILAFLASPYEKAPRLSLREWADTQRYRYIPPAISLPPAPTTGKDGKINITVNLDPNNKDDPLAPSWLMYSMNSALWHGDKFKKEFPNEKTYRHSLAEEVDSIHLLLTGLREQKIPESKYSPTIRALVAIDKDNMLECWILLDAPDQGTAQDYLAYRATHRDLMRAYIEKYDLHPA